MLLDALLNFVQVGSPLSLVAGAGVAIPSPGIIDLLGLGVGVGPTERIIGLPQSGFFGEDSGNSVFHVEQFPARKLSEEVDAFFFDEPTEPLDQLV